MNFSFIQDPRWNSFGAEKKEAVLGVAFDRDIASDKTWATFSEEKKATVKDLYFEKAKDYEVSEYPRTISGTIKDVAVSGVKSVVGFGESAVGLADIPTLGRAGKAMEDYLGYDPETTQEFLSRFYSPAQKRAISEVGKAKGFGGTIRKSLQYPSTIGHAIIESVPQMLGGAAVARKLLATGMLKATPVWKEIIAAAVGEGVVGAGSSAESIRQQTKDGVLTLKQSVLPVISGAGTALFSVAGGRVAKKFGIIDPDTFLAGGSSVTSAGVAKRIIGGGIPVEGFEELSQSMQEQVWLNAALDNPLLEGVGEAGATGLLTGMAMGAGFNVFTGDPTTETLETKQDAEKAKVGAEKVENISTAATVDEAINAFEQATSKDTAFDEMRQQKKEKADIAFEEIQNRIKTEGLKMQAEGLKRGTALTGKERVEQSAELLQGVPPSPAEASAQVFEEQPMAEGMRQEVLPRKFQPSPQEIQGGKEILLAEAQQPEKQKAQEKETPLPIFKTTEEALSFGKKATPEQTVELKKLWNESQEKGKRLKGQGKLDAGYKTQLYREAYEAAIGKPTKPTEAKPVEITEKEVPVEPPQDAPQKEWDEYEAAYDAYYGKEDLAPRQVGFKSIEQQKAERLVEKEKEFKTLPVAVRRAVTDNIEQEEARLAGKYVDGGYGSKQQEADDKALFNFRKKASKKEIAKLNRFKASVVPVKPQPSKPAEAKPSEAAVPPIKGKGIGRVAPPKPKTQKVSKTRTLRGAIKEMGGINFLNFKGELKDLTPYDQKALSRKDGIGIDLAVDDLIADGWLSKDTTVSSFLEELRTDPKNMLGRDRVESDISVKKEHELSAEEKKVKKEMGQEPEAPPEGEYVTMFAEDLPEGKELTLLEGKTSRGWDVYQVVETDDPFEVVLQDGIKVTLNPLDKVQVLRSDLPKAIPTEQKEVVTVPEKLFDAPEQVKVTPKRKKREKLAALDKVSRQETSKLTQKRLFDPNQQDLFAGKEQAKPEPQEPDLNQLPLDTIDVTVKSIREKTGETIKETVSAKEALEDVDQDIEKHYTLLACL